MQKLSVLPSSKPSMADAEGGRQSCSRSRHWPDCRTVSGTRARRASLPQRQVQDAPASSSSSTKERLATRSCSSCSIRCASSSDSACLKSGARSSAQAPVERSSSQAGQRLQASARGGRGFPVSPADDAGHDPDRRCCNRVAKPSRNDLSGLRQFRYCLPVIGGSE
jgi:hypothetical protein